MPAYVRYAHNDREEANIFFHYMLLPTDEVSLFKSFKNKNCYVRTVLALKSQPFRVLFYLFKLTPEYRKQNLKQIYNEFKLV